MAWTVSGIDIFDPFPVIRSENVVLEIWRKLVKAWKVYFLVV